MLKKNLRLRKSIQKIKNSNERESRLKKITEVLILLFIIYHNFDCKQIAVGCSFI